MKKFIYTGLLAMAAIAMVSCSEENRGLLGKAKGGLALSVNLDSELKNGQIGSEIQSSRASASHINKEDLTLRVTSADGNYQESWGLGEFPNDHQFSIGEYTVEAYYGNEGEEGFEKPYYHDHVTVKILENEVTPVNLTAAITNSIVTIEYTDDFKKYYSDYSSTITTSEKSFHVTNMETRHVYVNPGTVNVTASFTTPQGQELKLKATPFVAKARFEHTVIFGVDTTVGNGVITITYDDSLEMVDEVINLDDLTAASEPTLTPEGFTADEAVSVVEGSLPDNHLKMNLVGSAGITSVKLKTTSPSLRRLGWPSEVELVNAESGTQATLTSLGLDVRGLFKKVDRMAVIDFTNVCNYLSYIEGGQNQSVFTVTLTDRFERQTEPLTLTIKSVKALYEFDEFEPIHYYSPDVVFTFLYNGTEFEKNIKFFYENDRGTWTEAAYQSVTPLGESTYKVHIQVPPHEHDLVLKGEYGDKAIPEVTIPRIGNQLMADERNVFATYATVSVQTTSRAAGDATIYLVESDGSFTPMTATAVTNGYRITGLTPSTTYKLIAEVDGHKSKSVVIETEAAPQLPTAPLSDFRDVAHGSAWTRWQIGDGTIWGTNNPMTTSEGINTAAYVRISGTEKVEDAHSNNSAVLLRTVGWGDGNTNAGALSVVNHVDPGLLHLGSSREHRPSGHTGRTGLLSTDDLNCGLAFTSRPKALSFWCKYSAKNANDRGYAYIAVYDAEGNVIAENEENIIASNVYNQISVPLTYNTNSAKAAKIYVKFLSTNTEQALQRDFNWISSGTRILGSQLYIDDIELTY